MKRRTLGERIFGVCNVVALTLISLICISPIINTVAISLSTSGAVASGKVTFWPVNFTLSSYDFIMKGGAFYTAFMVSVRRVLLGVIIQMCITFLTAFPLSRTKEQFHGRTAYVWFFVFTMLFGGGIVPWYMTIKQYGLLDTMLALVLPDAVNVFNILLMLNFFRGIPHELEEAFVIDGARSYDVLFRLLLPLSLPAIATITLLTMVGHWNSWFDGMILMNKTANYPLATYLRGIIVSIDYSKIRSEEAAVLAKVSTRTSTCAQVVIAMIPVLCVYPFLQRFFVKGLVLGSVKG